MLRALVVAVLVSIGTTPQSESPGVLHIKAVLTDPEEKPRPVPRHALLISDNPATAAPRRIVTGVDGTAEVRLRPGNYTVESDRPVTFNGRTYQWTQVVDIVAGRDAVLELTAANADVETTTLDSDASFLLSKWQDSVVALWTPTTHASGVVIDTKGLIVTNQRVAGTATSVEVQITPVVKVAATVLAADPERDVAVLLVDSSAIAAMRPLPLPCDRPASSAVEQGQQIVAIGVPPRQGKRLTSGTVGRIGPGGIAADIPVPRGSAGGPVFSAKGDLVGLSSIADESDTTSSQSRIVGTRQVCAVAAAAGKRMATARAPSGMHLPVEPSRLFPLDALQQAAERRAGSLNPYQLSSSSFDIAFITPVLTYGTQYQSEQMRQHRASKNGRAAAPEPALVRPLMDFANWSEYVWEFPAVVLVRVTPRLVEGFWTKIGRAAARTQGVALPPFKRIRSGFSRLRVFCGATEVTPIHPFKLEHRVTDKDTIYEGLYVFDPLALGPHCGAVKVEVFSEKQPDKAEAEVVDPRIVEQVWNDFASYRAEAAAGASGTFIGRVR
jgi:S1-C subfamily serine protease